MIIVKQTRVHNSRRSTVETQMGGCEKLGENERTAVRFCNSNQAGVELFCGLHRRKVLRGYVMELIDESVENWREVTHGYRTRFLALFTCLVLAGVGRPAKPRAFGHLIASSRHRLSRRMLRNAAHSTWRLRKRIASPLDPIESRASSSIAAGSGMASGVTLPTPAP